MSLLLLLINPELIVKLYPENLQPFELLVMAKLLMQHYLQNL